MTESIGVIMQLPNINELSDKLGVKQVTVKAGRMKDIGNPFRELTEEEREFLQEHAEETHEIFKEAVRKKIARTYPLMCRKSLMAVPSRQILP